MTTLPHELDGVPERPRGAATWYEVLDVERDADLTAITRAHERALALIEGKSLGGYFMLDPAAIAVARHDIEVAFAILSDNDRRRAYDRSLDGDDVDSSSATAVGARQAPAVVSAAPTTSVAPATAAPAPRLRFLAPVDEAPAAARSTTTATKPPAPAQREDERVAHRRGGIAFATPKTDVTTPSSGTSAPTTLADPPLTAQATVLPTAAMPSPNEPPPVSPQAPRRVEVPATATPTPTPGLLALDGEVNGQTLKRLREARRLTIDELADATKIRRPYLVAIEEQDLTNLPSRVYLRGFLTQIARVLRVDKTKLADGYLAFIARFGR